MKAPEDESRSLARGWVGHGLALRVGLHRGRLSGQLVSVRVTSYDGCTFAGAQTIAFPAESIDKAITILCVARAKLTHDEAARGTLAELTGPSDGRLPGI